MKDRPAAVETAAARVRGVFDDLPDTDRLLALVALVSDEAMKADNPLMFANDLVGNVTKVMDEYAEGQAADFGERLDPIEYPAALASSLFDKLGAEDQVRLHVRLLMAGTLNAGGLESIDRITAEARRAALAFAQKPKTN